MRKILTATLAAGAMAAGVAQAGTATTSFAVNASVPAVCNVSTAAALVFAPYTPTLGNKTNTIVIAVKCTKGTSFSVALDQGKTTGGTITQRLMAGVAFPTNTLQYNLYQDSLFTTLFGDGTTGSKFSGTGVGLSTAVTVTAYGNLPDNATNQLAVPDSYADTVNVTVGY
jgi:spore coat protein U-like protein